MDSIVVYDMIDINSYVETLKPETFNGIVGVDINQFNLEFIKLLAAIYNLADHNVNELQKRKKQVKIIITEPAEEDFNIEEILMEVKLTLGNLILIYNDLYKIFVDLYNLEMTISNNMQNKDSDINQQLLDVINANRITITPEQRQEFIDNIRIKYNFTPLVYQPLKIELSEFNLEGLQIIGDSLMDRISFVKQNITELLNLANEFVENFDKFNIQLERIANQIKNRFQRMTGGGRVDIAKDKLEELKGLLDSFNIDSLSIKDMTIPKGINMSIQNLSELLSIFKTKAELLKNLNVEFNMIEEIPKYYAIPKDDFIGNLNPVIPNVDKKITNIDDIISSIKKKFDKENKKLEEINKLMLDIDIENKKINLFINTQSDKDYPVSLSNIGSIDDLKKRDEEIDDAIRQLIGKIERLKLDEQKFSDPNFNSYIQKKAELKKFIEQNPNIEDYIKSISGKLKIGILFFLRQHSDIEFYLINFGTSKPIDLRETLDNIHFSDYDIDKINKIKIESSRLKILNEIATKINSIENFGYTKDFFQSASFYTNFNKTKEYFNKLHKLVPSILYKNVSGINTRPQRIKAKQFILKILNIQEADKQFNLYVDIAEEFFSTINQDKSNSLLRFDELIVKLNSNTKITQYNQILDGITQLESKPEFGEFKELYDRYNADNTPIKDIIKSIQDKQRELQVEIDKLLQEKQIIAQAIQSYGRIIDWSTIFEIDNTMVLTKINVFKTILSQINGKLRKIYDIKYGNPQYKPILDADAIIRIFNIQTINVDWLNQIGGFNPTENIQNLNKLNKLNDSIKEFMSLIEKLRNITTELLILYEKFLENITGTIIFLMYRIVVIKLVKTSAFKIGTTKFNRDKLKNLISKLTLNKKQSFNIIKTTFISIIINIIKKMNQQNIQYLDLNPENKSIFVIFMLYHLDAYLKI
jgi:hypothetical protein